MEDDFGIRGGLKNRTLMLQAFPKGIGIDQISVMTYRNGSKRAVHDDGLGIAFVAVAGGGVTRVADCIRTSQTGERVFIIDIRDVSHGFMRVNMVAIGRRDPSAFLSPMLKGIQSEICQTRRVGMIRNSKDPTHRRISLSVVNHLG